MTFSSDEAEEDVVVEARRDVWDAEGRFHDIAYQGLKGWPDFVNGSNDRVAAAGDVVERRERYLNPGGNYDIHFSGSDAFPETTYEAALYLPEPYEEVVPGSDEPIVIPAGEDFIWQWEPAPNRDANARLHYHWISFMEPNGQSQREGGSGQQMGHTCYHADDGEFTIPAEVPDDVPSEGFVLYGTATVRSVELRGGDLKQRRLDFVGVYMFATPYVIE